MEIPMILHDGTDTREVSPHKFGGDPMAESLHHVMLDGDPGDLYAGDTDIGWANQYGRRLLRGDTQGFVWVERYPDAFSAETVLIDHFADWFDNNDL